MTDSICRCNCCCSSCNNTCIILFNTLNDSRVFEGFFCTGSNRPVTGSISTAELARESSTSFASSVDSLCCLIFATIFDSICSVFKSIVSSIFFLIFGSLVYEVKPIFGNSTFRTGNVCLRWTAESCVSNRVCV